MDKENPKTTRGGWVVDLELQKKLDESERVPAKIKLQISELQREIEMNSGHIDSDYIRGCIDTVLRVKNILSSVECDDHKLEPS